MGMTDLEVGNERRALLPAANANEAPEVRPGILPSLFFQGLTGMLVGLSTAQAMGKTGTWSMLAAGSLAALTQTFTRAPMDYMGCSAAHFFAGTAKKKDLGGRLIYDIAIGGVKAFALYLALETNPDLDLASPLNFAVLGSATEVAVDVMGLTLDSAKSLTRR